MLATVAPGSNVDLAPAWLVAEATLFGKVEHQRNERVQTAARWRQNAGEGGAKGKGTPTFV